MALDQAEFELRCEWGERGVAHLAPINDAIVIVDVLSFSAYVDVAVGQGSMVFPYRWKDESAARFAAAVGAELADGQRRGTGYSLSPASLVSIPRGTRLMLPPPRNMGGGLQSSRPANVGATVACGRHLKTGWGPAPS